MFNRGLGNLLRYGKFNKVMGSLIRAMCSSIGVLEVL